ncbi:hypothetical protein QJS10_CPA06g02070 [Acorus calamus]|uniref:Uncharacterized protein n=1 Tax=Acorus calamus TaxID=4465 RepID=A0AAV9ENH6_ACOCL|nr:hypothetical protein QJS10_CPA06g02070 [Acorus calamus]
MLTLGSFYGTIYSLEPLALTPWPTEKVCYLTNQFGSMCSSTNGNNPHDPFEFARHYEEAKHNAKETNE